MLLPEHTSPVQMLDFETVLRSYPCLPGLYSFALIELLLSSSLKLWCLSAFLIILFLTLLIFIMDYKIWLVRLFSSFAKTFLSTLFLLIFAVSSFTFYQFVIPCSSILAVQSYWESFLHLYLPVSLKYLSSALTLSVELQTFK